MKKIIPLLLVLVLSLTIFTSCSGSDTDTTSNNATTTEATTKEATNKETVTITSRNKAESLNITFDTTVLTLTNNFTSELSFTVSDEKSELNGKAFNLTFISDITAMEDYNASLGDASVVIKFTEPEKITFYNTMVYSYDESWYDEFKTRYFLYELNGDLIKITINEKISNESLEFIFNILEFSVK